MLPLDREVALAGPAGDCGLAVVAFAVPGKVPLYREGDGFDATPREEGEAVGLAIIDRAIGARFHFVPGFAVVNERLRRRLAGSALVFFDGTLWQDDEMIRLGIGVKTGNRMGHISMSGAEGAIAALADLGIARRVFMRGIEDEPVALVGRYSQRGLLPRRRLAPARPATGRRVRVPLRETASRGRAEDDCAQ